MSKSNDPMVSMLVTNLKQISKESRKLIFENFKDEFSNLTSKQTDSPKLNLTYNQALDELNKFETVPTEVVAKYFRKTKRTIWNSRSVFVLCGALNKNDNPNMENYYRSSSIIKLYQFIRSSRLPLGHINKKIKYSPTLIKKLEDMAAG